MPQRVRVEGGDEAIPAGQLKPGELAVVVDRGGSSSQRVGDIVTTVDQGSLRIVTVGRECWNDEADMDRLGLRVRRLRPGERITIE